MEEKVNCKFHGSMIGCKYGTHCRYSHSSPNSVPFCYYYNNCRYGNYCKFRHINFPQITPTQPERNQLTMLCDGHLTASSQSSQQQTTPLPTTTQHIAPQLQTNVTHTADSSALNHLQFQQQHNYNSTASVDLTIFKNQQHHQCINSEIHLQCPSLLRLSFALKYYALLNPNNNPQYQDTFTHFATSIYQKLLDDYIHFINHHQHQIEDIQNEFLQNKGFTRCNITNCHYAFRHHHVHQTQTTLNDDDNNDKFTFFAGTMDSIHYYIFHIFDVGLRSPALLSSTKDTTKTSPGKNEFFDYEFAEIRERINANRSNTNLFKRFKRSINDSKFNINIQYDHHKINETELNIIEQEPGVTFLDSIYQHLQKCNIDNGVINNLKELIDSEQFDTESVSIDIDDYGQNGNISTEIKNKQCIATIRKFIANSLGILCVCLSALFVKCG